MKLLAGPEMIFLLDFTQQIILYLCRNPLAVCGWYWSCSLEL